MSRWIVFDEATAEVVKSRAGIRPEVRPEAMAAAGVVELALNSRASLAVVAGEEPGRVTLLRVSRAPTQPAAKAASNLAPAGFLGLYDSIDMDSEPERPKKWWQKILD